MKKFVIGLTSIVILFFISLKFIFWEPDGFTKNSLPYYFKVDDEIKRFPIFSPSDEPNFLVRVEDGLSPSAVQINYETELSLSRLLLELKKLEFKCSQEITSDYVCEKIDKDKRIISIIVRQEAPIKINATFLGF